MTESNPEQRQKVRPNQENAALYRVAYEEGRRALDDQTAELENMRGRAVQFLAFVGVGTAFLVGAGLRAVRDADKDRLFYSLAVAASVATLVAILFTCLLMSRRISWGYRADAKAITESMIERQVPGPTEASLLRDLALACADNKNENDKVLKRLRARYLVVVIAGSVGIVLWSSLVWVRA